MVDASKHSDSMILSNIPSKDDYQSDPEVCCSHQAGLECTLLFTTPSAFGNVTWSPHNFFLQVWDLIVVGAGVAGAALAYRQGQVRWHTDRGNQANYLNERVQPQPDDDLNCSAVPASPAVTC